MKKILVIINSALFMRNYISTNVFEILKRDYELHFVVEDSLAVEAEKYKLENIHYYKLNKFKMRYAFRLNQLNCYQYLYKSKAFRFKLQRLRFYRKKNISLLIKSFYKDFRLIKIFILSINFLVEELLVILFKNRIIHKYIIQILKFLDFEIKAISNSIDSIKPDLLILPSCSYDTELGTLYKGSKRINSELLLLIDNWDNLSSKSTLIYKPNYLGVWGNQTKKHASEIHDINKENIFPIGTPRFEYYFSNRSNNLISNFNFKYILFLGTALPFDEFRVIRKLNTIFNKNKLLKEYKIVYRPHPWRLSKTFSDLSKLNKVKIDPQVFSQYKRKSKSSDFQPNLEYYPPLLQNSSLIIGGLTSMIIEASIMYKRYIVLAHSDKTVFESPDLVYNSYPHFENLDSLPNLNFCNDLNKLEFLILNNLNDFNSLEKNNIDNKLNYFIRNDDKNYKERLLNVCKYII